MTIVARFVGFKDGFREALDAALYCIVWMRGFSPGPSVTVVDGMKNDRLRIPIDSPYLTALGLATYCFVRLEWGAVYCCEKLGPAYLRRASGLTAGGIAKDLVSRAARHPDPAVVASLGAAGAEFARLVNRRNDLLHANPAAGSSGHDRLIRRGQEWTVEMLEDIADEFASNEIELNRHYYEVL